MNRTFFFHPMVTTEYRGKQVRRRATVAAIQDLVDGHHRFRFGIAVCSEKDQFVKKYGRCAALGRAKSSTPENIQTIVTTAVDLNVAKNANKYFLAQATRLLEELGYSIYGPKKQTHENAVTTEG